MMITKRWLNSQRSFQNFKILRNRCKTQDKRFSTLNTCYYCSNFCTDPMETSERKMWKCWMKIRISKWTLNIERTKNSVHMLFKIIPYHQNSWVSQDRKHRTVQNLYWYQNNKILLVFFIFSRRFFIKSQATHQMIFEHRCWSTAHSNSFAVL